MSHLAFGLLLKGLGVAYATPAPRAADAGAAPEGAAFGNCITGSVYTLPVIQFLDCCLAYAKQQPLELVSPRAGG